MDFKQREEAHDDEDIAAKSIATAFQFGVALGFAKKYDEMDKVIEEVKKAITPEPKTGKWIPVTERLPEKDGKYLITEVDGYVTCDYFRLENGDWRITFPIAWMPLPSPYKGDKS